MGLNQSGRGHFLLHPVGYFILNIFFFFFFRLHYSVTTTCMFAFSLIVSAKQYVGNPIDCIHSKDIPEEVLNTYCWIHSTYTIPSAFWKRIGFDVAHPGVDKTIDPEERRYHKYYQWVCFCLFFQVRQIFITSLTGWQIRNGPP